MKGDRVTGSRPYEEKGECILPHHTHKPNQVGSRFVRESQSLKTLKGQYKKTYL